MSDLPGMWEESDLLGGRVDCEQPANVTRVDDLVTDGPAWIPPADVERVYDNGIMVLELDRRSGTAVYRVRHGKFWTIEVSEEEYEAARRTFM